MAAPTYVGATAINGSISTYTITSDVTGITTDDVEFAIFESANQAISGAASWAGEVFTQVGVGTAADTVATRLAAWWRRWDGTHVDASMQDPGNHIIGQKFAVRGCTTSGNPWDVMQLTTSTTTEVTNPSGTGLTTTVADCLYVAIMATGKPDTLSTTNLSGSAITGCTSVTERIDNAFTSGNGGGLYVVTGVCGAAGSYGPFSGTLATAAAYEILEIALKPPTAAAGSLVVPPRLRRLAPFLVR